MNEPARPDLTPRFMAEAFQCPYDDCGIAAPMHWNFTYGNPDNQLTGAECGHCFKVNCWMNGEMIYPLAVVGPAPNPDMPTAVRDVYNEARRVSPLSRKSAAGLLRLGLQLLIDDLEPGSADINKKIGAMVTNGLSPRVQQAMDTLRVVGNEAVHPGTIDLDEDSEVLPGLFALINIVVEQLVSQPKQISGLFEKLPEAKRKGIEDRDRSKAEPSD